MNNAILAKSSIILKPTDTETHFKSWGSQNAIMNIKHTVSIEVSIGTLEHPSVLTSVLAINYSNRSRMSICTMQHVIID